jgi:serine/threonine protein kinase
VLSEVRSGFSVYSAVDLQGDPESQVICKVAWVSDPRSRGSVHQMQTENYLLTGPLAKCAGVPRVLQMGESERNDEDGPVLVLVERPVGTSLESALTRLEPKARVSVLTRWGARMERILNGVHECEVVHGDVKPANLILVEGDPHLIDFGAAFLIDFGHQEGQGLCVYRYVRSKLCFARKPADFRDRFHQPCVYALFSVYWGGTLEFSLL